MLKRGVMPLVRLLRSKVFTVTLCACAFLLVTEWYVRYKGYIPAQDAETIKASDLRFVDQKDFDCELGWKACPSTRFPCGEPVYTSIIAHIRADGQREQRPLCLRDDTGSYHVLVLGCSYAFGYGINSWETFVWKLNQRFPDVVFDNYAYPGYGTLQCKIMEKRLLNQKEYDLVIYVPFREHVKRNIFGVVFTQDIDSSSIPLPSVLKMNYKVWYVPTAEITDSHQLIEHYPYYESRQIARYSAAINTLYRLNIFFHHSRCISDFERGNIEQLAHWQEVYWRLLDKMNDIATQHGSEFAVMCLEDENDPASLLQIPHGRTLTDINSDSPAPLAFPPAFTYKFVGNGRQGQPDSPKFHTGGLAEGHPIAPIHQFWADCIGDWVEAWCRQHQKVRSTLSSPERTRANRGVQHDKSGRIVSKVRPLLTSES